MIPKLEQTQAFKAQMADAPPERVQERAEQIRSSFAMGCAFVAFGCLLLLGTGAGAFYLFAHGKEAPAIVLGGGAALGLFVMLFGAHLIPGLATDAALSALGGFGKTVARMLGRKVE